MIRPQLLLFLTKPLVLLTACALGITTPFVLLQPDPLLEANLYPFLFVLLHTMAVASWLHPARRHCRYCHGRVYTRNTLWFHHYLAAVAAILAVWLPATLLMASPAHGFVQDLLFKSPYYPLMRSREAFVPFHWLFYYAVLFPPFHYAGTRQFHPSKGSTNGYVIAIAAVLTLFVFCLNQQSPWGQANGLPEIGKTASILVALIALVADQRLHHEMEIRT